MARLDLPSFRKEWRKAVKPKKKQGVLLSKRDRHLVFNEIHKGPRETPPTTFLFLLIFNCQITDEPNQKAKPSKQKPPKTAQLQETKP